MPEIQQTSDVIKEIGDIFAAISAAQYRATLALTEGRIKYSGRLGFAERNMLEVWLFYAALTRMNPRPRELAGARRQLRRVIGCYRAMRLQERLNITGRLGVTQ